MAPFQTRLGIGAKLRPATYQEIKAYAFVLRSRPAKYHLLAATTAA